MAMPAREERVVRPYGMESKGEDAVEGGKTSGIVFPARERTGNRVADTLFNTRARAYFWSLVRT